MPSPTTGHCKHCGLQRDDLLDGRFVKSERCPQNPPTDKRADELRARGSPWDGYGPCEP